MAKILGFTKIYGEDWFPSSQYGTNEIQDIPDPEGGHAINAPTSIPSPFARMDLVRKSFQNIGDSPELKFHQRGETVVASKEDERTVSQCLDLAELLFFYENFKDKIEILEWNKTKQINQLKDSDNPGHNKLGDVLDMYLRQDAKAFNFDAMQSIYIVKYNHKVIGGTSPLTLFFNVSADDLDLNLTSTKGKTFFKDIVPLYERDSEFQKYIYLLFKSAPILGDRMLAFQEYLNRNLDIIRKTKNQTLYNELNTLNVADLNANYSGLYTRDAGQVVEVFNVNFKTIDAAKIPVHESDFIIASAKYTAGYKPLALQNNFNKPLKYINSTWSSKFVVPFMDSNHLNQRVLPGLNIKYPYLTIGDFLEETLIRLVYPINSDKYFDGNLKSANTEEPKGYLLPLKPFFFDFFSVNELLAGGLGKPGISIEEGGIKDGVRVLLKIPIKNGEDFVIFERLYNGSTADAKNNKGAIIEQQFGITVFPFIRGGKEIDTNFNIQLVDRNVSTALFDIDYQLSFFDDGSRGAIEILPEVFRTKKLKGDVSKVTTKYYGVKSAFDYLQVDSKFGKGIIIPKWRQYQNSGDQFTFAVDFGTTNSHVEYSVNNNSPKPFEINSDEVQAVSLFEDSDHNFSGTGAIDIRTSISREFVPKVIKKGTAFNFPLRTAISQSKSQAPAKGGTALMEFNIPFVFEKEIDKNSKYFTNLKWDNKETNNDSRIRAFLEQLIMMMRNKVLMLGGNLKQTRVIWTYPISMSSYKRDNLARLWDELYATYINGDEKTITLSESLAPYYYFESTNSLEGKGYVTSVLMDIGGGTSDVVVYKNNKPQLISSYKFAGNTIFGDGYNEFGNLQTNRLALKYKREFDALLDKEYSAIKSISDDLFSNQRSADYHAFLFSLGNNVDIKNKALYDFNALLAKDNDLRLIFLYFYAAKVYHIAKLMKYNELDLPSNLIFSGNGSKILNIISANEKLISAFTQEIFAFVFKLENYPVHGLKIRVERDIPKAITSKGSIALANRSEEDLDLSDIKRTLTCLEHEGKSQILAWEIQQDDIQAKISAEVEAFNDFFEHLLESFDCEDKFGISYRSICIFKEHANKHIKEFLKAGIAFNQAMEGASMKETAPINDTLFFYPLVETIQKLIYELANEEVEQ